MYGGATNLWGLTWTVNQANTISTNFFYDSGGAAEAGGPENRHDAFHITIHYTARGKLILANGKLIISEGKVTL